MLEERRLLDIKNLKGVEYRAYLPEGSKAELTYRRVRRKAFREASERGARATNHPRPLLITT